MTLINRLQDEQGAQIVLSGSLRDLASAFLHEADQTRSIRRRSQIRREAQQITLVAQLVEQGTYNALRSEAWLEASQHQLAQHRKERRRAAHA